MRTFCVVCSRRLGRARRVLMRPPPSLGTGFPRSEARHCKAPEIPLGTPIILRKTASTEVILHRNASKECSVWNLATALEVFMFAPFVLNLPQIFISKADEWRKMERAIETRTCGTFYAGKRKQGGSLHTEGVWGAHDEGTAGGVMARCRA